MKRSTIVALAVCFHTVSSNFLGIATAADEPPAKLEVTIETAVPVVVKTIPAAGASDVDPKLTEIKVTFSKEMMAGSWSWVTITKESFPTLEGQPKYLDDKRTCVVTVKLEAGKDYAIWLNTDKFTNFKDPQGRSALPYLLVFRTKK